MAFLRVKVRNPIVFGGMIKKVGDIFVAKEEQLKVFVERELVEVLDKIDNSIKKVEEEIKEDLDKTEKKKKRSRKRKKKEDNGLPEKAETQEVDYENK